MSGTLLNDLGQNMVVLILQIADAQENGFLFFELARKPRVGLVIFSALDGILENRSRRYRSV